MLQKQHQQIAAASARSAASHLNKAVLGGGAMFIASGAGNGLNYLFTIGLARALGPIEFGLYAIGLTYFNILSLIAPLGTATGSIKFVSEFLARDEHARARESIKSAIIITIVSSVLLTISLVAGASSISYYLYDKPELTPVLILFALTVPFAASLSVLVNALQAFQTVRPTILIKYVWEPVGKIALVGAALFLDCHLLGVIATIGVVFAISTYMAARALKAESLPSHVETDRFTSKQFRTFVAFCAPIAVSNFVGVVAPRSDILTLGYWVSTQEIGVYLACLQTAGIIALALGSFETAFAPFIARVLALNDLRQLKTVYQALSRLVVLFTVPLCVIINMLAGPILGLFGEAFRAGWIPLAILTTGHMLSSVASSPNHILLMGGHSAIVMRNTITIGVVQIAVSLLLIPLLGTTGAAVATAGSFLIVTVARVIQVWRIYHVHPFSNHLVKPFVAGLVMTSVMLGIKTLIASFPYGLEIPCLATIGIIAYAASLLVLGVDPSEKTMIHELIRQVYDWRSSAVTGQRSHVEQ